MRRGRDAVPAPGSRGFPGQDLHPQGDKSELSKRPKLTFRLADSITGGHSALFAGTEATRTHSVFLGSVASLIVELKRYVLPVLENAIPFLLMSPSQTCFVQK